VEREGIKLSLNSKCPEVIIGDFEILSAAPLKAMLSGLGDMLAKYIAVTEWKITNIVTGEYYCEEVASLVRLALNKCVSNAAKLLQRDKDAVKSVFEGLIISGAAMEYAGLSRPASGVEHYISHVLDMRSVAFKTPVETHGIQCAIGTLYALKMYEHLKKQTPNREKALAFVKSYDYSKHTEFLREFIGKSAEILIKLEKKEQKYNPTLHERRLDVIINNWNTILETINKELPPYEDILTLWKGLGGPISLEDIGVDNVLLPQIFSATKDIRNKYCLSFLAWDLGLTDELLKIV
jgi:glycerol-1-phosphate dehydrogenase [NAD(P)+]